MKWSAINEKTHAERIFLYRENFAILLKKII
jgi:hypothetical protein